MEMTDASNGHTTLEFQSEMQVSTQSAVAPCRHHEFQTTLLPQRKFTCSEQSINGLTTNFKTKVSLIQPNQASKERHIIMVGHDGFILPN